MIADTDLPMAWLGKHRSLLIKAVLEQWSNDALLDLLCHLIDKDELVAAVKDCDSVLFQIHSEEHAVLALVNTSHEEEHRCLVKVTIVTASEHLIELLLVHDTILALKLF